MKYFITALFLSALPALGAIEKPVTERGPLEKDLKSLDVQDDIPAQVSKERLYSIQTRNVSLKRKMEVLVSAAQNFTGDGFLETQQLGGEAQYHINDNWSLAAGYSKVFNTFHSSADRLLDTEGILPEVDYAKSRLEVRVQYNLFYGKFRFSSDSVLYFDQYLGAGYASHDLASGPASGPLGDLGFAFWISHWGSVHLGAKDYYYTEKTRKNEDAHHNVHGYVQVGYLFGI